MNKVLKRVSFYPVDEEGELVVAFDKIVEEHLYPESVVVMSGDKILMKW